MARDPESAARHLAATLLVRGAAKTGDVVNAFARVDRSTFVPKSSTGASWDDAPLRAWFKIRLRWDADAECVVHLSAPSVYAVALEALQLTQRGPSGRALSFLNVGSGSGYLSAMAAVLLGSDAVHHCIELSPALVATCRIVGRAEPSDVQISGDGRAGVVRRAGAAAYGGPRRVLLFRAAVAVDALRSHLCGSPQSLLKATKSLTEEPLQLGPPSPRARLSRLLRSARHGDAGPGAGDLGRLRVDLILSQVQFAPLVRPANPRGPEASRQRASRFAASPRAAFALEGPRWAHDSRELFPAEFKVVVAFLHRAVSHKGTACAAVPWDVWRDGILPLLAYNDVAPGRPKRKPPNAEPDAGPPAVERSAADLSAAERSAAERSAAEQSAAERPPAARSETPPPPSPSVRAPPARTPSNVILATLRRPVHQHAADAAVADEALQLCPLSIVHIALNLALVTPPRI
ncbi:hypothetical protein M885DRAFT_589083 [Pelagophyceae sp. CCMP2097]|nr:hypothetical protein M885DRAFT_589083 [Pelagophyceae sp. CCMP2097]